MYQIYALKCGERDTTACEFFYREPSHERITLHFFVWLILGGPHPVLVDTGFGEDDAAARGLRGYVSPATMLGRLGIRAEEIPTALITHLHWDHWAGYRHFPNAEFWIQRDEVAFWTGAAVARYDAFKMSANAGALAELVRLNYANRVRVIQGDREVLPGLRVHRIGGHTAGLQIVSVETAKGPVVLTSDASHFYRNVERFQPVQIITSLPEMLAGFETIHALAGSRDRIVAGHDPEVCPAVRGRGAGDYQDRLTAGQDRLTAGRSPNPSAADERALPEARRRRAGDQARAAPERDVRVGPLEEHQHAVAEADQEEDVDREPGEPREEARELEAAGQLAHGLAAADRREAALVAVAERLAPADRRCARRMFRAAWRPIWIAAGATPGTGFPSCSSVARSPITKTSFRPGTVRVGSTRTRPARSSGTPERSSRAARPRRRPPTGRCARGSARCPSVTPAASMPVTRAPVQTSTPRRSSCVRAFGREVVGVGREHARHALDQDDARVARVDVPEVPGQRPGARSRRARRPARRRSARRRR